MRQIMKKALLVSLMLVTSLESLQAQDADTPSGGDDRPILMTDGMPGLGNLLPVQDLLTSDEGLSTEGGPDFGGEVPVDGGLSLLLAAGAAFGARRLLRRPVSTKG